MNKNWLIVCTMTIGIFLCMLDTTVMNIALPAIEQGLNISLNSLSWALNVYTISFACLTIPLGQIADRFGRNRIYLLGLSIFVLGSLISGSASTIVFLVAGRAFQSIGAAIVFPASMTIGLTTVTLQQRTKAVTLLGVTQGLAAALGPTIGGIVTTLIGWRWVFLINLPLGLVAIGLCLWLLPMRQSNNAPVKQIDLLGMLLSMLMLFSLTVTLIYGKQWGWHSPSVAGLAILALVSFNLFIIVERHNSSPMVPLQLFKKHQFSGAAVALIVSQILMVGVSVIMPTFLTHIQGQTELGAALIITPMSVMIFITAPISGSLLDKLGPRLLTFTGMTFLAAGYLLFSFMNPAQYWQLISGCIVLGSGFGIIAGPLMVLGAANFTGTMLTASQSVLGVIKQIGTLLAVAIFVSALTGNIQVAKKTAITDVDHYTRTLPVPRETQVKIATAATTKIKDGGDSGQTAKTPTTQHISRQQVDQLVAQQSKKVIQAAGGNQLPSTVKHQIKAQVRRKVYTIINRDQRIIDRASKHIAANTKRLLVTAFFKPYRYALPVAIAAISVAFCFEKKHPVKN